MCQLPRSARFVFASVRRASQFPSFRSPPRQPRRSHQTEVSACRNPPGCKPRTLTSLSGAHLPKTRLWLPLFCDGVKNKEHVCDLCAASFSGEECAPGRLSTSAEGWGELTADVTTPNEVRLGVMSRGSLATARLPASHARSPHSNRRPRRNLAVKVTDRGGDYPPVRYSASPAKYSQSRNALHWRNGFLQGGGTQNSQKSTGIVPERIKMARSAIR